MSIISDKEARLIKTASAYKPWSDVTIDRKIREAGGLLEAVAKALTNARAAGWSGRSAIIKTARRFSLAEIVVEHIDNRFNN